MFCALPGDVTVRFILQQLSHFQYSSTTDLDRFVLYGGCGTPQYCNGLELFLKKYSYVVRDRNSVSVNGIGIGIDIEAKIFFAETETLFFFQILLIFSYFLGQYKFL